MNVLTRKGERVVRIAVDAMGGDHAPAAPLEGAIRALAADPLLAVVLVGPEAQLRSLIPDSLRGRLTVVDAREQVGEEPSPARAVRRRSEASVTVAARLVAQGRADGGLSVGNTGAVLAAATLELGLLPGVTRPMAGAVFPFAPRTFLADLGANAEVSARHLVEFARVGAAWAQWAFGMPQPTVALLANGREAGKGTRQVREAARLLAVEESLHFVGLAEPQDVVAGRVNVAITDGYAGNLVLKFVEALSGWYLTRLDEGLAHSNILTEDLRSLRRQAWELSDLTRIASAIVMLGVDGVFLPGHGRAEAPDIARLIARAATAVRDDLTGHLARSLGAGAPTHPERLGS